MAPPTIAPPISPAATPAATLPSPACAGGVTDTNEPAMVVTATRAAIVLFMSCCLLEWRPQRRLLDDDRARRLPEIGRFFTKSEKRSTRSKRGDNVPRKSGLFQDSSRTPGRFRDVVVAFNEGERIRVRCRCGWSNQPQTLTRRIRQA